MPQTQPPPQTNAQLAEARIRKFLLQLKKASQAAETAFALYREVEDFDENFSTADDPALTEGLSRLLGSGIDHAKTVQDMGASLVNHLR